MLIIDDCSSDSSAEIIEKHAAVDSRIRAYRNDVNLGMVANWNRCLEISKGEYIRYLFADDLMASNACLEKMVAVLNADPGISLVASARTIIDDRSVVLKTASRFPDGLIAEGEKIICRCLYESRNLIGEPSVVMFRKNQSARGFSTNYKQFVDLEMWFYLLEKGKFAYIGEPLSSFREHPTQQTRLNLRQMTHIDESFLLLKDYLGRPYAKFGRITRDYLFYNQNFRIWKLYRQKLIDRGTMTEKIGKNCGMAWFLLLLPVYKACNPFFKLRGRLRR